MACTTPICTPDIPAELVAQASQVEGLAQDTNNLYWVTPTTLHAMAKAGGADMALATGDFSGTIARTSNRLLFGTKDGQIMSLADGNSAPVALSHATAAPGNLTANETGAVWSTLGTDVGQILSAPFALPDPPLVLVPSLSSTSLAPLALDASKAYFGEAYLLKSVPTAGGAPAILYTGGGQASDNLSAIAVDSDDVYFLAGGSIVSVAKTGGQSSVVAAAPNSTPGLAVDDAYVYWTGVDYENKSEAFGLVFKAPKSSGTPTVVAAVPDVSSVPDARSLLLDSQCVFWIDTKNGRVMKAHK